MSRKIVIVGAGNVGATIAYTLAIKEMASEIVLIDLNRAKAEGEAMDIIHGTSFSKPINLYAGDYADAKGANMVIITAGVGRKPGQSRLELASVNTAIIKEVAEKIVPYASDAVYLIVSNPVDVLTYAFIRFSGLSEKKIIGSGTMLDTARLRTIVSRKLEVSARNVHAYVFGEHGDSSVFPWSVTSVIGMQFRSYLTEIKKYSPEEAEEFLVNVEKEVRMAGGEIIKRKGATFHGVSIAVSSIVDSVFSNNDAILTVSSMANGRYGIENVCLSLPCVLGTGGIAREVDPPLLPEEFAAVQNSAAVLKETLKSVGF